MSADLMPAPAPPFKGEIMDFDLGIEIDHRKRRRNRTTQSCLNCHTSKRKCDRKRPCQRCIQLGLTGLCVYEVDDPALRDDPNIDETTRLRNRIAELESLVRELRGKPHPRWAEPNYCDGDAAEKWHSRASRRTQLQLQRARQLESAASPASSSSSNSNGGANGNASGAGSPVVKTEGAGDNGAGAGQLYRLSPSPGPTLALDGMYREHPSHPHAHQHPHSQSQSGCSSPGDPCTYTSASGSSSSSPALGYARHALGGMGGGSSSAVLALAGSDLYYHQPYIRDASSANGANGINGNGANGEPCACGCLTNPAAAHPLIALTHQLTQTVELLRQLPEHAHAQGRGCTILKSIGALHEVMHGGSPTQQQHPHQHPHSHTHSHPLPTPSPPFDPLPTPESELMSPVTPAGHALDWAGGLGGAMGAGSPYESYFPEGGMYGKAYLN